MSPVRSQRDRKISRDRGVDLAPLTFLGYADGGQLSLRVRIHLEVTGEVAEQKAARVGVQPGVQAIDDVAHHGTERAVRSGQVTGIDAVGRWTALIEQGEDGGVAQKLMPGVPRVHQRLLGDRAVGMVCSGPQHVLDPDPVQGCRKVDAA